jgi:peptide/nickel transport system permease protein
VLSFIGRRLVASLAVLLAATYLMYVLTAYSGDPLEDLRTSTARNKEQLIERRIEILNLDVPPYFRYFIWLKGILAGLIGQLDLGKNLIGQPVDALLASAVGHTLQLVTSATLIAIFLGVLVGVATALRQYSGFDYTVTFISFLFYSLPVFWVAVLLKQYLAIGFNDFLVSPQVSPLAMAVCSLLAAFIWSGILGGNWRRRGIVAAISGGATAFVLLIINLTHWFENPSIGLIFGAILGMGTALIVTSLSTGLENKRARNASLAVVLLGLILWLPFDAISLTLVAPAVFGIAAAFIAIGVAIGWFYGGVDRAPVARTAGITAALMAGIIGIDRFMQAWQPYFNSNYVSGRPFATVGSSTPNLQGSFWVMGVDTFTHLLLPTLALLLIGFAGYTRYSRASMLEIMDQDFIRTARAKGLSERTVVMRHAFRNAMIPLTTLVAFDFAGVIGGAVITERVFAFSGMGKLFLDSLLHVDLNPVMGFFLITGTLAILFNLIADVVYGLLDPRIRVE